MNERKIRDVGDDLIKNKTHIVFIDGGHTVRELDAVTHCVNDKVLLIYLKPVKR
jgi:hypothetical protein